MTYLVRWNDELFATTSLAVANRYAAELFYLGLAPSIERLRLPD